MKGSIRPAVSKSVLARSCITAGLLCLLAACGFVDSGGSQGQPPGTAGIDQTVNEQTSVVLQANTSDDIDGYFWGQNSGPKVTLANADTARATFVAPPVEQRTVLGFTLTTTDKFGASSDDQVQVIINNGPTAHAGADRSAAPERLVTLDGAASSDTDAAGPLRFAWQQIAGPLVSLTGTNTATPSFIVPVAQSGELFSFRLTVTDDNGASDTDDVAITVNLPPIARAGPDRNVTERQLITLNGGASADPEGGPLTFQWTQVLGPLVTLTGANTAVPSFTAPDISSRTLLRFRLTVTDDQGVTGSDLIDLTVFPLVLNTPPTANAGPDQSVQEGQLVTLHGSATDSDGAIIARLWTQIGGPPVVLLGATSLNPRFTAPAVNNPVTLTFRLRITDNGGASDSDSVVVIVNPTAPANDPPVANAGANRTVAEGQVITLNGGASNDPDGNIVAFQWSGPRPLSGASTATPSFTAPNVSVSTPLTFTLTVTDNDGATDSDTVTITVATSNQPPTANAGPNKTVTAGQPVTLNGSGSDPDGGPVSFQWTQIGGTPLSLSGENTANVSFTAPAGPTQLTFRLTVTDTRGATATDFAVVTVRPAANRPPIANAGANQTVTEGATVQLNGGGSNDPDGTIQSFQWVRIAGPAVTLNGANTAAPTFTAPNVNAQTSLTFRLTVRDNDGASDTDTVIVTVNPDTPANDPPVANAGGAQTVNEGATVNLNAGASNDPDGSITEYQWVQTAGPNVNLNGANTASPTFTAPAGPASLTFRLTVTDNDGATASDFVTITVRAPANQPPTAVALAAPQTVNEGETVNLNGGGSNDPDGNITDFQWAQTGGPNVALNGASTATPSFTAPTGPATLTFSLTVTDNDGATDSDTVTVTVRPPANQPPNANAGSAQTVNEGETVNLNGSGSNDPDGNINDFEWTQTDGPNVNLNGANTATPSFTAPAGPASLTFRLTVTDNDGDTDSDFVTITVNAAPNQPPNADAGSDQDVTEGVTVNLNAGASNDPDGSIASFEWSQTSGQNVNLNGADTASPTFTAPDVLLPEQLTFQLTVTDNDGATDSDSVTVTVNDSDDDDTESNACWVSASTQTLTAKLPSVKSGWEQAGAPVRFDLVTNGKKGTAVVTDPATGAFLYTPHTAQVRGSDTFTYKVENAQGKTRFGEVTVVLDPRIMPLGDSITAGVIDGASQLPVPERRVGYRKPLLDKLMAAGYPIDFVGSQSFGAGIPGFDDQSEVHTMASLAGGAPAKEAGYPATGIYAWLNQNPADFVLLHVGSEDLSAARVDHVEAILNEIDRWESDHAAEVRVLLARVIDRQPVDPRISAFNDQLQAMAEARINDPTHADKITIVDQHAALSYPADMSDRLHPTAAGYNKMAKAWFEGIQSTCQAPPTAK